MADEENPWVSVSVSLRDCTGLAAPSIDPKFAAFQLRVAPSRIHGWGVFAEEPIPARRKVIEYTGEPLSEAAAKERASRTLHYLFQVNGQRTIDGFSGGSGAQYINHSCAPNLRIRVIRGHALLMSLRRIDPGEELTYDYRFQKSSLRNVCMCGAPQCRGSMNEVF